MTEIKKNLLEKDIFFSLLSILFGIFLFIILGQLMISIVLISSPILYIILKFKKAYQSEFSSFKFLMVLNISFLILLIFSMYIYYVNYQFRPISYFVLISLLAVVIAVETLSMKRKNYKYIILVKVIVISLFHRAGLFFNFPSLSGVDGWNHAWYSNMISETGTLEALAGETKYFYYPVHHILVSSTDIITNLSIIDVHFFVISGTSVIVLSLFVFKIGEKLVNPKVGLLATLIVNFTHVNIRRATTNITPGWLVIVIFSIIFYIVIKDEWYKDSRITGLLIFFITITVITHQLTTFVILVSLVCLFFTPYIYQLIYKHNKIGTNRNFNLSMLILLFFISFIFLYWNHTYVRGKPFFEWKFGPFITALTEESAATQAPGETTADIPLYERVIQQMFYLILPFFAFGGVFLWIKKQSEKRFGTIVLIITLFALITFLPIMGPDLLTHRWQPILYILLSIVAAAYTIYMFSKIKSLKIKNLLLIIAIFLIVFLMITTNSVNQDNPIVDEEGTVRDQFNEQEISSIRAINQYGTKEIILDARMSSPLRYYSALEDSEDKYLNGSSYSLLDSYYIDEEESINVSKIEGNRYILIRESLFKEPIIMNGSPTTLEKNFIETFREENFNQIYDNGEVYIYYKGDI